MLQDKCKICIQGLLEWMTANKLSVNIDKTCYQIFNPHPRSRLNIADFNLAVNNVPLQRQSSVKYLGVYIDEDMKWTTHIRKTYESILKFTSIFYKLRIKLPISVLKNLYYAVVHSTNYCMVLKHMQTLI